MNNHIHTFESFLNEGFSSKTDIDKVKKALEQGKTVRAKHARFPASFKIVDIDGPGKFATVDYEDGKGNEEMVAMNIDPKSIVIEE